MSFIMSGGGSLYSEVQVEQVLSCLGGLYTVRSILNKFYHVWGWGVSIQ